MMKNMRKSYCYVYENSHSSGTDKIFAATVNDINLRRSGLGPLGKHLRELIDTAFQARS
jgi:hypothetical protein